MNKIKICFTLLFILFCGAVASFYFYTRTSHVFEVTLSNISSDKSTIGGVLIVHGTDVSLNFLGREFPSEFSEIASLGVSDKFISHIKNLKKQDGNSRPKKFKLTSVPCTIKTPPIVDLSDEIFDNVTSKT